MEGVIILAVAILFAGIMAILEHKKTVPSLVNGENDTSSVLDDTPNYKLSINEAFIMRYERVSHGNKIGELVLTNLNLIFVTTKGVFRTVYIVEKFPISEIKQYNGEFQIFSSKTGKIEINFNSGIQSFEIINSDIFFSGRKAKQDAIKCITDIKHVLIEEPEEANALGHLSILGTVKTESVLLRKNCESCGAMVSGEKGMVARCFRCGYYMEL